MAQEITVKEAQRELIERIEPWAREYIDQTEMSDAWGPRAECAEQLRCWLRDVEQLRISNEIIRQKAQGMV